MDITSLFCSVDDFCQQFESIWKAQLLSSGDTKRNRHGQMTLSEMLTIVIAFHHSGFRTFKYFYQFLRTQNRSEFPTLLSYNRFVQIMPSCLLPLCVYLNSRKGRITGIHFIDATSIVVCHNKRIRRNKVFKGLAQIGKTTMGWFFGFKLHVIVNDVGELLAFSVTPGNIDDRKPVPGLSKGLIGKLFGDKGYISQKLFEKLFKDGVWLITHIRKNMKNQLMPLLDKILLRKRALIETIFDQLKNIMQIAHSRHRSPTNFMVNLVAGLAAYTHLEKKPSLNLDLGPIADTLKSLPPIML